MEAVTTICPPFPRRRNASTAGRTVFSTPPTFVENVRRTFASSSMPVPTPAFAKTRSRGASASQERIHSRIAASSATSTTSARTAAPAARQADATASSRPRSRPQRKSPSPRFAHSSASALPIPELAPVMRTFISCVDYNKKAPACGRGFFFVVALVASQGLEPQQAESESAVLPLHHEANAFLFRLAGSTGLEPATPGSTVQCANQLRHNPVAPKSDV